MVEDLEYTPQDNIIKESIAELVQPYTTVKKNFFLNADKEEPEAQELAGKSYGPLIEYLYILLDLSKPDNLDLLDKIKETQKELERLDKLIVIDTPEIERLKELCNWADTGPLIPHLKTQPNIGRVKPLHTRN